MNFLSVLYAKAGITVDGVTTLNNTATALTPATNDNSTKIATTAFVKNQNYYPYPTGTTAQYVRGDGSLATFPTTIQQAQRLITEVYNETGATLTKGTVVYINGGHGNLPTVTKALANSDATSAQTYGVVQSDITDNNNGFVVVVGSIIDLDTFAYANGTILYLSPTTAGGWTSTKPYAPQHIVYIGIVTRQHPTQGVIEIRIQNGYEMDELHNVSAQNPANGDILQFNYSTQLWTKTAGTTTNITEGTNLYYTDARSRAAFSEIVTGLEYNSTTGVLSLTTGYSIPTTASQSTWDTAYNDSIVSAAVTGTTTKTLTLTQQDGGTITASWSDLNTDAVTSVFGRTGAVVAASGDYTTTQVTEGTNLYFTDARARAAISLTTTGTSGAATYSGGVLNIPQYQAALTNPITGTGTTNYLPKFTGTSTLGDSSIFDNGTNVGIGTTSPNEKLTVNGKIYANPYHPAVISGGGTPYYGANITLASDIGATAGAVRIWSRYDGSGYAAMSFERATNSQSYGQDPQLLTYAESMRISGAGSILIGTTTDAGYKLDVNGTARIQGQLAVNHSLSGNYGAIIYNTSATGEGLVVRGGSTASHTSFAVQPYDGSVSLFSVVASGAATFSSSVTTGGQVLVNTGTANQNTKIFGNKVGMSRTSDGAEVVYFSKNTDLGAEGTTNIHGYNGIQFRTQGAETVKLTLNENGNLGLGITPTTSTSAKYIQFGAGAAFTTNSTNNSNFWHNTTFNASGNALYAVTGQQSSFYRQINGAHQWFYAAAGTAGNAITFTQQMTLDASGQLLIGTTTSSSYKLDVNGTARVSGALTANNGIFNGVSSTNLKVQNGANANTLFLIQSFGTEALGENASILFKSAANSTDTTYAKGLISFVNNGTGYGRGSLIFATNNSTNSTNVTASDVKLTIAASGEATFSSSVTATNFIGAGTGLTGTASALSIGGNAAYATTAGALTSMLISQFTNDSGYITSSALSGYALVNHTHDLGRYSLQAPAYIDGLTTTNFRNTLFGNTSNTFNISTARWNTTPTALPGMNSYGTMLAWSGADTQGFIATDYSTANITVGGGNASNINWSALLVHSGNIGSQSVSYATTAGSASQIDGWDFTNTGSNLNTVPDSINSNGISYTLVSLLGQSDGALYSQAYSSAWQHQVFGDYRTGQIAVRGKNNGTWQAWRTVIDSGNIGSYALPTSGGTLTGDLTTSGWFINSTTDKGLKNSSNGSSFWSSYGGWTIESTNTSNTNLVFYTTTSVGAQTEQFRIGWSNAVGIYLINDQGADASIVAYQGAGYGGYLTGTWNITNNLNITGDVLQLNDSAIYDTAAITYRSALAASPSVDIWFSGMAVDITSSFYYIRFTDTSFEQARFRVYENGRTYIYGDILATNSFRTYTSSYLRLSGTTGANDWLVKQSDSAGYSIIKNTDTLYSIGTTGTHSFYSTQNLLATFTNSGSTFGVTQGNYNRAYFHVTGAVGATHAMFGTTYPLLFGSNYPTVYYNMYYSSGWKIASGTSVYGGATVYDPVNGIFYWYLTGTAASTDGTVTPAIQFRIDRNGQVSIGTTASSTHKLYVTGTTYLGGNVGVLGNVNATNLNASTLTTNGIVYSNGGTLTNINPSDLRLKEEINPLEYGLKEVMGLNPVTYKWKDGSNGNQRSTGLIAQEVQKVMPEYVKTMSDGSDLLGLDSYAINIVLINAIKELKAEIEILKNK